MKSELVIYACEGKFTVWAQIEEFKDHLTTNPSNCNQILINKGNGRKNDSTSALSKITVGTLLNSREMFRLIFSIYFQNMEHSVDFERW